MTADEMIGLPWTWRGPREVKDEEGEYWEVRIEELPDFCVFGETPDEVIRELIPSLRAFLESYIEHGDPVPLPPLPDQWEFRSYVAGVVVAFRKEEPEGQPRTVGSEPVKVG